MQIFRHLTANNIKLTELPFTREISMEAYLVENPDVLILDNDELSTVTILAAEISIKDGRASRQGDGRIDLLARYGDNVVGVVELKLGELTRDHLRQLEDYLSKTEQIKEVVQKEVETKDSKELKYIGLLVGTAIDQDLSRTIHEGYIAHDAIPIAALIISRYRGQDNNIYVVTDTIFKNTSRKFDKTKYLLNGEIYGKSRLVLAVLRKYVEDNPKVTFAQLQKTFHKKLQGSYGCFDTLDNAQTIFTQSGYKRHFLRAEDTIALADATIAVCNEWGITNIPDFVRHALRLGFKIKEQKE
jgi:hypothetical protein